VEAAPLLVLTPVHRLLADHITPLVRHLYRLLLWTHHFSNAIFPFQYNSRTFFPAVCHPYLPLPSPSYYIMGLDRRFPRVPISGCDRSFSMDSPFRLLCHLSPPVSSGRLGHPLPTFLRSRLYVSRYLPLPAFRLGFLLCTYLFHRTDPEGISSLCPGHEGAHYTPPRPLVFSNIYKLIFFLGVALVYEMSPAFSPRRPFRFYLDIERVLLIPVPMPCQVTIPFLL